MVPSHVEPHAAPSIPQPVRAGRADVAQQEICHGESEGGEGQVTVLSEYCGQSLPCFIEPSFSKQQS